MIVSHTDHSDGVNSFFSFFFTEFEKRGNLRKALLIFKTNIYRMFEHF